MELDLLNINSGFYSWIRGGLLVLFVYHIIIYIQNKDQLHRYYSIYLLCLTIYLIRDAFTDPTVQYYYQYISFTVQFIGYSYFIYFCRSLVETEKFFPKLDKFAVWLSYSLLFFTGVLLFIQHFYGYEAQTKAVAYSVPFSSFCAFFIFYMVSRKKSRKVFYLIFGSIVFLILANISSIKMLKGEFYLIDFKVHRMFYYFLGAIIQSTIFAILTGNYFREIQEKKREVEVNLLKQTNIISELKMTALKSQMNPHFLFNSLNSINNFIIKNDVDKASDYITKFSSLIRKVLQATDSSTISLQEELDVLSIYVKLEQMRFKDSFDFVKEIDPKINLKEIQVVPLFLQPFFENAIWHGLSLKVGAKKILLKIKHEKNQIIIEIIDNGIGINESKKQKKNQNIKRKSYGIKIVKERLNILYPKQKVKIDFSDSSNEFSTGTKVFISFPVKY